jgi:hypothetical protein
MYVAAAEQASWWATPGAFFVLGAAVTLVASVLVPLLQAALRQWHARNRAEAETIERLRKLLADLVLICRFPQSTTNDDLPVRLEIKYTLESVRDEASRSDINAVLDKVSGMDDVRAASPKSAEDDAVFDDLVEMYFDAQKALGTRLRKLR